MTAAEAMVRALAADDAVMWQMAIVQHDIVGPVSDSLRATVIRLAREDTTALADALSRMPDAIPCDECGAPTSDPTTCPHGREQCPDCMTTLGAGCKTCVREASDA